MPDINEFNLTKTVSLGVNDDRFQLIYATELYGSLFAAYARFITADNNDGTMKITQIDVVGINYKGPINMGVYAVGVKPLKDDVLPLSLVIQADDTGIWTPIKKLEGLDIDVSDGQLLKVERQLFPMNPNGATVEERAFLHGKFDSEFYSRNGVYVKPKPTIPESEFDTTTPLSIPDVADFGTNPSGNKLGASCENGWAKFVTI